MTSRRSSGSIRAESAVEPTRSENITVTWRRSAVSRTAAVRRVLRRHPQVGGSNRLQLSNGRKHLAAMAERCNADLFEVLIGQVTQYREIDIVFGKALGILGQAELFEPVRNLLHRGPSPRISCLTALLGQGAVYPINCRYSAKQVKRAALGVQPGGRCAGSGAGTHAYSRQP